MTLEELMDEFRDELLSDELFKSKDFLFKKLGLNFVNVEEVKELSIEELRDNYIEKLYKILDWILGVLWCQLSLMNIVEEAFSRLKTSFKEA